jgi:1-acyl-sn-glycerol-3-phosphate acyltransferase
MTSSEPLKSDPRARPEPFTFFPPKSNRLVIGLVKLGIKRTIRNTLRVTDIEISDDDLEKLRRLKGQRCLVTPSHSGGFEPHIIMYLSKRLQDDYNYVAAMELFKQSPIYRWLMPRLGVYSIIRGAVDRSSFSMTRKLLAAGKRWLVIFPEGQTIWQNSMVIPFQQGVIQLAFKGFEDAARESADAHLRCIPIAIKYVYSEDMHGEIDASLSRLESKLSISEKPGTLTRYGRLRRVAESVLTAMEKTHELAPSPDSDMNQRIANLKEHAVSGLEHQLGLKSNDRQTLLDRIRALFNAVDRIVYEEPTGSEYEQQLFGERQRAVSEHYEDLWRLLQFVSI